MATTRFLAKFRDPQVILYGDTRPRLYAPGSPDKRIMQVIVEQIRSLLVAPLHLPMPSNRRRRAITTAVITNSEDARTFANWARTVGTSSRTLTWLFVAQMGLSFRLWCRRVWQVEALWRLASREPVTSLALDPGYDSYSAFVTMFNCALGTPFFSVTHRPRQNSWIPFVHQRGWQIASVDRLLWV
jgi:AraC-like DNA-binding protein